MVECITQLGDRCQEVTEKNVATESQECFPENRGCWPQCFIEGFLEVTPNLRVAGRKVTHWQRGAVSQQPELPPGLSALAPPVHKAWSSPFTEPQYAVCSGVRREHRLKGFPELTCPLNDDNSHLPSFPF